MHTSSGPHILAPLLTSHRTSSPSLLLFKHVSTFENNSWPWRNVPDVGLDHGMIPWMAAPERELDFPRRPCPPPCRAFRQLFGGRDACMKTGCGTGLGNEEWEREEVAPGPVGPGARPAQSQTSKMGLDRHWHSLTALWVSLVHDNGILMDPAVSAG